MIPSTQPVHSTDGVTTSLWQQTVPLIDFPALPRSTFCEICVIGGGISGLTAAYLLLKEGKKVTVLDDSPIGDGQTGRTSAHLADAVDDRFKEIKKMHGEQGAKISYESHAAGIALIEKIVADEKIDCDFARIDGYLFSIESDPPGFLEDELTAARDAGAGVEMVDRAPLDFNTGPALKFHRQARFHPQKYLAGLCKAIEKLGGTIHCNTRVTDAQGGDPAKGEKCKVTTEGSLIVTADAVIVATNAPTPINDWAGIYTKQASYRTYVVGCLVPKGSVTDALYWDTADPYHYVRIDSSTDDDQHDVLIVGGADHKTGQPESDESPFDELAQWVAERFPNAQKPSFRWSGQVNEPDDGVAFIGRAPTAKPNVYCITGDSGMGLTHGSLGAILIRDLIIGRPNEWETLYDPSRKQTGAVLEFIKENANAVAKYKDYIAPGDLPNEDALGRDEGAIIRHGLKLVAAYRDENDKVHKLTSVCPHLGCSVRWNEFEKTWDCPCHGSRFNATGEVIMGPAIDPLKAVE